MKKRSRFNTEAFFSCAAYLPESLVLCIRNVDSTTSAICFVTPVNVKMYIFSPATI